MKKILIGISIILLLVIIYVMLANGVPVGSFKIESINDMKAANDKLEEKFTEANKGVEQEYPQQIRNLKNAVNTLTTTKEKYESKIKYAESEENTNVALIKTYEITYLWAKVDGYADKRKLDFKMEEKAGKSQGTYNLEISVIGSYTGIIDFIYDIENDEYLDFKIENFAIAPNGATVSSSSTGNTDETNQDETNKTSGSSNTNSTNTGATNTGDTSKLQATFIVSEIGINYN